MVITLAAMLTHPAPARTIEPDQHFAWGLDNNQIIIQQGSSSTEAVLTIHNVGKISTQLIDSLNVDPDQNHLLTNRAHRSRLHQRTAKHARMDRFV